MDLAAAVTSIVFDTFGPPDEQAEINTKTRSKRMIMGFSLENFAHKRSIQIEYP